MPDCILAIDTSTPEGQVAVWRAGEVLFEENFRSHRSHNAQLFVPLGQALDLCGAELKLIVAGTGPGSYTGVRIGIAAAQGLAWSRDVPVIGLPTLLAPRTEGLPGSFTVCGDARRGLFFAATVDLDHRGPLEIPLMDALSVRELRLKSPYEKWYSFDEKVPTGLEGVSLVKPSAAGLAGIAGNLAADELVELSRRVLEPVYLSAPFVTSPKKK